MQGGNLCGCLADNCDLHDIWTDVRGQCLDVRDGPYREFCRMLRVVLAPPAGCVWVPLDQFIAIHWYMRFTSFTMGDDLLRNPSHTGHLLAAPLKRHETGQCCSARRQSPDSEE
jgi:hypothetical protein